MGRPSVDSFVTLAPVLAPRRSLGLPLSAVLVILFRPVFVVVRLRAVPASVSSGRPVFRPVSIPPPGGGQGGAFGVRGCIGLVI